MQDINKLIFVLTVCNIALGFILGAVVQHDYPQYLTWLFK